MKPNNEHRRLAISEIQTKSVNNIRDTCALTIAARARCGATRRAITRKGAADVL